jgi:hypothetical protein
MKQYRVWVRDITLQSVLVEAESANHARQVAEEKLDENGAEFEAMDETVWEISSVEEIIE